MLSILFPKLCDKLPEPTYFGGGCRQGVGRGTLLCQPNAAGKGLSWWAGNQASSSISATSLWSVSLLFWTSLFSSVKWGEAIIQMTGVTLKNMDDWFLDAYQSHEARTNWL